MAGIELESIINNPRYKITVALGGKVLASGFITSELTLNGSASYVNPLESSYQEQLSTVIAAGGAIAGNVLPSALVDKLPNITAKTVQQSISTYQSTAKPHFTLGMIFVAVNASDDVRRPVSRLQSTIFPSFAGVGLGDFIKPPNSYRSLGLTAEGTLNVGVGNWFRAAYQLMTNVSFTFSKEVIESGAPLYATGSISFEPYRAVSSAEINGYLLIG